MAELMQHLNEAARTNNADYIDQLVEMGVDVNQTIWNDETPLMLAISNNSVEAVKLMVAKGADISLTDYSGSSPLMYAVDVNNLEIVEFLLEKGADINHRNSSGLSPFIIAVEHNNEDMAKFLIKNGADISPSAKYPQINPLAYAIRNDNPMLAKLLVEMGSELTGPVLDALADKVRSKYAKGFEAMLAAEARKNGINFMILGDNYPSFLNLALSKNALRFMDLLIDGGMKPDLFIYQGRTILMDAVILGNVDAVRLLLKKGADVNKRTNNGATAMYFAEQSGNNEIIDLLKPSFVEEVDREALYNVKMTELNETRHNAMIRSQVRASMEAYAFGMVGVNKSDEELLEAFLDKAVKDMEMGVNTGISILLSPEGESFLSLVEPSLDLKGSSILKYTQMMNAIRDYRGYISTYAGVEHKVPNFMLIKQNKLNDITKSVRTFRIAGR
jgi:ankyrin repeat protein